jgi:hypothetical protein
MRRKQGRQWVDEAPAMPYTPGAGLGAWPIGAMRPVIVLPQIRTDGAPSRESAYRAEYQRQFRARRGL